MYKVLSGRVCGGEQPEETTTSGNNDGVHVGTLGYHKGTTEYFRP